MASSLTASATRVTALSGHGGGDARTRHDSRQQISGRKATGYPGGECFKRCHTSSSAMRSMGVYRRGEEDENMHRVTSCQVNALQETLGLLIFSFNVHCVEVHTVHTF